MIIENDDESTTVFRHSREPEVRSFNPLPEAVLENGELVCPCGHKEQPNLVEYYLLNHEIQSIDGKAIKASGWNGSSLGVNEEGEGEILECRGCFGRFRIPTGMYVDWI